MVGAGAAIAMIVAITAVVIGGDEPRESPVPTVAVEPDSEARECRTNIVQPPQASDELQARIDVMSLEEKIAQLLVVGFHGTGIDVDSELERSYNASAIGAGSLREAIANRSLGGVVLFGRNIEDADQVASLVADMQAVAAASGTPGLLVVVDHEGGQVNRLRDDITNYPGAPALGAVGDVDLMEEVALATAQQLQSLGINVILAPVADLAQSDGDGPLDERSFGSNPELVAESVAATVRGFEQAGVASAPKHFPGLGSALVDSHVGMPSLSLGIDEWEDAHALPFAAAIHAGARIVLVGHARVPALDPTGTPSTVSQAIVADELGSCLGFDGVVMTDALDMGAVGSIGSQGEAAVGALAAGAHVILAPRDFDEVVDAVTNAVERGEVPMERLDAAVAAVLMLKLDLGIVDPAAIEVTGGRTTVGQPHHVQLLDRVLAACAAAGVTC